MATADASMNRITTRVIQLIQKQEITDREAVELSDFFHSVNFFKEFQAKLPEESYQLLLRSLKFKKVAGNQWLFHKGDKGNILYVLISGDGIFMVPKTGEEIKNFSFSKNVRRYMHKMLYYTPNQEAYFRSNSLLKSHKVLPATEEEREKLNLAEKFADFVYKKYPKPKLTRAKSMLGLWIVKSMLGDKTTDYDTAFQIYRRKAYWQNLFLRGLPPLCTDQSLLSNLFPALKEAGRLNPMMSFGDKALLDPHSKRLASVLCSSECCFATLAVDTLVGLGWMNIEIKKEKLKYDCIANFSMFNYWFVRNSITDVGQYLKEGKTIRGDYVYKRGQRSMFIAFLTHGEITITLKRSPSEIPGMTMKEANPCEGLIYQRRIKAPYVIGTEEMLLNCDKRYFSAKTDSVHCDYFIISNSVLILNIGSKRTSFKA